MEEQFYFLKMMQEHLGWTITICLIVLLMVISIFAKSLSGILGKYIQDSVLQKKLFRRKLIISKHPLFSKYRLLVNQRIKFLRCECPLRKKIFTDLMIIRIETYDKILKDFIKRDDINRLSVMLVIIRLTQWRDHLLCRFFSFYALQTPSAGRTEFGIALGSAIRTKHT